MNIRTHQLPGQPGVKMNQMQLSITVGDKTYAICDSVQYQQMVMREVEKAANELISAARAANKPDPTNEEVMALAREKVDKKGFAKLDMILERMTPEQREQWKQSYRFTPITRRPG